MLQSTDLALRGGVVALLVLIAAVLLREHPRATVARLGAAFALGAGAYVICSAGAPSSPPIGWQVPLLIVSGANCVLLRLLASALFEEEFRLRWWHGLMWAGMGALAASNCLHLFRSPSVAALLMGCQLIGMLTFAALALLRTVATWRADLLEARRRLRLFVVACASVHLVVSNLVSHLPTKVADEPLWSMANAVILLLIVSAIVWQLLRTDIDAFLPVAEVLPSPVAVSDIYSSPGLIAEVERAMTRDQLYRDGAMTIGGLAAKLGLLEYKLRRIINQGLGYRNFNAFLNHYRVEHAKAALCEPGSTENSVLTVAMDCGFQSLGPFNRAFKAQTGMTPSEFRRTRPAHSRIG